MRLNYRTPLCVLRDNSLLCRNNILFLILDNEYRVTFIVNTVMRGFVLYVLLPFFNYFFSGMKIFTKKRKKKNTCFINIRTYVSLWNYWITGNCSFQNLWIFDFIWNLTFRISIFINNNSLIKTSTISQQWETFIIYLIGNMMND